MTEWHQTGGVLSGGCWQEMRRASEIAVVVETVGGAVERSSISELKVERVGD